MVIETSCQAKVQQISEDLIGRYGAWIQKPCRNILQFEGLICSYKTILKMIILWRFSARSGPTLLFHEWSIHQNLTSDTTWWWLGKGQFVPRSRAWLPNHQKISKRKSEMYILSHPYSSFFIFLYCIFQSLQNPLDRKMQMRQAAINSSLLG